MKKKLLLINPANHCRAGLSVNKSSRFPPLGLGIIAALSGCPMDCKFCSVTQFNGHKYRQRPIEDVLDELENTLQKKVFFSDDNIIGYEKNDNEGAIKLFKGMIERGINKEWFCQASINFGENIIYQNIIFY